ncbi:MAG: MraY family glycosyltransferase [Planctomycetia bacterium]|jgi:UDP-GlcNAc:undecaprenyl-phosphate GlcNAc-1-phosphate transferase|nr:MraY family glycosyltransferase [Planctomycetia bacterium]
MFQIALGLFFSSLVLGVLGTAIVRRYSARIGLMDQPGWRKVHQSPIARSGGIAIFWAIAIPLLTGILAAGLLAHPPLENFLPVAVRRYLPGLMAHRLLALWLLACTLGIHLLGLADDRQAMAAVPKLIWQLIIAGALVGGGELIEPGGFRVLTFIDHIFPGGALVSAACSVLWIVVLTNAFNFMDNMDGLSAGVAMICGTLFFVAALQAQQWFICGLLLLYVGATLGFLVHNFPPAKIFMGDGGSMVLGFFLSALTIRTTFYAGHGRWYAVLMPLLVAAVPLYDFVVVCLLRLQRGRSPFVGDTNHFSHRLTRHGFSQRGAVLVIYAVTLASGLSAPLLAKANGFEAVLIGVQCLSILTIVGILERLGEHVR